MRAQRGPIRALAASTLIALVGGLSACSDTPVPVPQTPPATSPTPRDDSTKRVESTPEPVQNDLSRLPLKRALRAGNLSVAVQYGTQLPVRDWRAGVNKPVHITLTSANEKKRGQKIYLSRVTVNVTTYDSAGVVDGPRTLQDTTNITPGFIVTYPETYNQSFALPAVDDSSTYLVIDFTYELVLQASKDKDGRNFSKQVATDTLVVPIAP